LLEKMLYLNLASNRLLPFRQKTDSPIPGVKMAAWTEDAKGMSLFLPSPESQQPL
jgi:hypothetical protein